MAYRGLATFLLLVLASVGARSQSQRLVFSNAIHHTDTNTYEYQVNINQNRVVNETIVTAKCNDTQDPTAILTYSLTPSQVNLIQHFSINSTSGEVKLTVDSLTLEDDRKYDFHIRCSSSSTDSDVTASLRVCFQIQNDFPPVFSITTQLHMSFKENNDVSGENGIIYDFTATDNDRGDCGIVRYSIASRNTDLFQINSTTGVLSFIRSLDRETKDQHTVLVQATNPLPLCSNDFQTPVASVDIRVNDTNDTPPQFSKAVYNTNVTENTEGSHILISVTCNDPDINSRVLYFSQDPLPDPFFLDPEGNIRVEGPIDYESTPSFSFLVFCRDERGENQIDNATVNVAIVPINEHRPTFHPSVLLVTFSDTTPAGTVIIAPSDHDQNALKTYTVTDKDDGLNHGEYNFTITQVGGSDYIDYFDLNHKTGALQLKQKIMQVSCEQAFVAKIQIRLTACDIAVLSTCDILTINIYVLKSDCSSYFSHLPQAIPVSELSPTGSDILSLPCDISMLPNDHFSYNMENGSVNLSKTLDFETKDRFTLKLLCKNNKTSSIDISVLPENEHRPVFDKSVYIVRVNESAPVIPQPIEQLKAVDKDRDVGGNLTYTLAAFSQYFTVDPDGQLWQSQILPESETIFSMTVTVCDGEYSANTTVIILKQFDETENDSGEFIILIVVFSATLALMVALLLFSWYLICHLLCRRNCKKRVGTFSRPNTIQNRDYCHYDRPDGQPIDCLALNSASFANDPAFKGNSLRNSTRAPAREEPQYEAIICKTQAYSENCRHQRKSDHLVADNHLVAHQVSTSPHDCYISMHSSMGALNLTRCTIQGLREPATTSDGGTNSAEAGSAAHQPLKANASLGDMESSLEFGGAVETSLEFGANEGISLDFAGPSRPSNSRLSPRTTDFEMIAEEVGTEIDHQEAHTSLTDDD